MIAEDLQAAAELSIILREPYVAMHSPLGQSPSILPSVQEDGVCASVLAGNLSDFLYWTGSVRVSTIFTDYPSPFVEALEHIIEGCTH